MPSLKSTALGIGAASLALGYYLDQELALLHDLGTVRRMMPIQERIKKNVEKNLTLVDWWNTTVQRFPNKKSVVMIEDDGSKRTFTFTEMEAWANRLANFARNEGGMKPGETVALFMENRPEFIATWLAFSKIGCQVALINTAIKEKGLAHCIRIANAKAIVYGVELTESFAAVQSSLPDLQLVLAQGELKQGASLLPGAIHVEAVLPKQSESRPPAELRAGLTYFSPFGAIYTSGTTGLPKAARVTHSKLFSFGVLSGRMFDLEPSDVVYTALPLFHTGGGGMGACGMMCEGRTMVLRRRFSAKSFWKDCAENDVTAAQYIGELCRYLLSTPASPYDRAHRVRIAFGNGLRPEIWKEFQSRFAVPQIGEFYGATEAQTALFNLCKTPEAVGTVARVGTVAMHMQGLRLAKFDVQTDALVRDKKTGLCVLCDNDEPGELLMQIMPDNPIFRFEGYQGDAKGTEKKIARDVLVKGDQFFRSGDLLRRDKRGYVRFVDRIGDSFRWKGENCSTAEVAQVVSVFPGIEQANVYGVLVANNLDGRAPCAALTLQEGQDPASFDFAGLLKHSRKELPNYSVPLFLRIVPRIEVTATLKHTKTDLRDEGVDLARVRTDPVYVLRGDTYVRLTPALYAEITRVGSKL